MLARMNQYDQTQYVVCSRQLGKQFEYGPYLLQEKSHYHARLRRALRVINQEQIAYRYQSIWDLSTKNM